MFEPDKFLQFIFVIIGMAALAGVVITRDDGPKWKPVWRVVVAMYKGYVLLPHSFNTIVEFFSNWLTPPSLMKKIKRGRRIALYLDRKRNDGFPRGLFFWLRNYCPIWFIRKITSCSRCAPLWLGAFPAYIALMIFPQSIYILLPLACVGYAYAIE